MPPNLRKVAAAMNAYPWTRLRLTEGEGEARSYCAIGALLRHAGVPRDRITAGEMPIAVAHQGVLRTAYGISDHDHDAVWGIMGATDTAGSRAEAIRRVLCVLSGVLDPDAIAPRAGSPEHGTRLPPAA